MSEQESKTTEETNLGGNLDAAGSASAAGSLGASASSKKSEEKRKPKKLGQKGANGTPAKEEADVDVNGEAEAPSTPSKMSDQQSTQASRSKSRQASRARGRGSSQPPSDTDSAYRSDVSQKGKRNRNRNRGKAQAQSQAQSQDQDGGLLGGGGPLGAVDEVGETLNGVTDGIGNTVNDTAGKALSAPHEALGGLLSNKKKGKQAQGKGGQEAEEKDEGENEQLRLRLDLNLDIEVQLKAKIHGDLTLGLLTSLRPKFSYAQSTTQKSCSLQHRHAFSTSTLLPLDWRHEARASVSTDTIYALSTAPGRAAIAVIRISGPSCIEIYQRLCPGKSPPKPRTATLRRLYSPENDTSSSLKDRTLDHGALVLYFPAPHTVTGEDILELHVHGGPAIVRSVLEAISKCGPARDTVASRTTLLRPAEPGEFTKRAFYNGRLDLTQAEALGETLAAETEQQRRLAISGADSGLAKRYEEWRQMLLYARGELEALIDFSEDQHFDESPVEFMRSVTVQVLALRREIDLHLRNASKGELLRNGISIALLGAPNAGKSSLLNRIVGREAAIVSAEEGTTRDIVDVTVDIGGWLCRLGDMAGLRATASGVDTSIQHQVGFIEQEGIRRARERALHSDVVVVLLSVERGQDYLLTFSVNPQVLDAVQECHAAGKTILVALNKIDMVDHNQAELRRLQTDIQAFFPSIPMDRISLISCRNAASNATTTTDPDPGGIQSFLSSLTNTFSTLTTAIAGDTSSTMTPAEAQAYWTASLSVTHRQSAYLRECRDFLDEFLDQADPRQGQALGPSSETLYHVDRHDDLVGPRDVHDHAEPGGTDGPGDVDIVTAAEHLRFAAQCLARITGRGEGGDVEDVLGVVFEK